MTEHLSRRGVLQAAATGTLAATTLGACAMGGGGSKSSDEKGQQSAENPLGVKEDAPLEVVIFNGGFGEDL